MSMFRRPTDDSSASDTSSEESETEEIEHSNAGTEEIIGADLTTAGTVSSGESVSVEYSRDDTGVGDVEHVRNMMLASLLEDFYRTRAAELFNTANPGASFHRQSPEIQPLARNLFAQASQALTSNGLLPANVVSNEVKNVRGQYLAGFDTFGLQNIKESDLLFDSMRRRISASSNSLALVKANVSTPPAIPTTSNQPMIQDLALRTERLGIVPHPVNEMKLSSVHPPHSHYQSSFHEMRLLGRGGFGRVYQTYNFFDKKEYAVKKIPLSPKLSQQYRERGHSELASILREVQALAQLDHCNVVRYHATWIEDPTVSYALPEQPIFNHSHPRQRLIADRPTYFPRIESRPTSSARLVSHGASDGITFEADSVDEAPGTIPAPGWSHNSHVHQLESSIPDSDIFTDGVPHNIATGKIPDDPSCYVLHVQMSMYPVTLAHYLSPPPTTSRRNSITPSRRHCFHLVPAIRILLGILCGLQYIHARGFVHRDIKPSNIFLSLYEVESYMHSREGYYNVGNCPVCLMSHPQPCYVNPRIGDFGLVADLARDNGAGTRSRSSSNTAVGTEYYRPPPSNGKALSHNTDEKLDVYALGVIFVELLWRCGTSMERINLLKNVQKGEVSREVINAIESEGHFPGLGKSVEDCIKGMTARDQSLRWSCSKTKEYLDGILAKCRTGMQHPD